MDKQAPKPKNIYILISFISSLITFVFWWLYGKWHWELRSALKNSGETWLSWSIVDTSKLVSVICAIIALIFAILGLVIGKSNKDVAYIVLIIAVMACLTIPLIT